MSRTITNHCERKYSISILRVFKCRLFYGPISYSENLRIWNSHYTSRKGNGFVENMYVYYLNIVRIQLVPDVSFDKMPVNVMRKIIPKLQSFISSNIPICASAFYFWASLVHIFILSCGVEIGVIWTSVSRFAPCVIVCREGGATCDTLCMRLSSLILGFLCWLKRIGYSSCMHVSFRLYFPMAGQYQGRCFGERVLCIGPHPQEVFFFSSSSSTVTLIICKECLVVCLLSLRMNGRNNNFVCVVLVHIIVFLRNNALNECCHVYCMCKLMAYFVGLNVTWNFWNDGIFCPQVIHL